MSRYPSLCQREAVCWAHLHRDFHDAWGKTQSALARDAANRIGTLYGIEWGITRRPIDEHSGNSKERCIEGMEAA